MKKIYTGKGYISALSLLAIWSLSLVVDLPGLAISPILSVIDKVFPGSSHLEGQLLELLPNFCIFPFILLSGKLSMSKNKVGLVVLGLSVFLAAGIAYFFCRSIVGLIVVSCFLGMGCGLIIPLAAGLLAEFFSGKYRLQQMGIKSGIANGSLVVATFAVGLIESDNWHLPFLVYLVAALPLLMSVFLRKGELVQTGVAPAASGAEAAADTPEARVRRRVVPNSTGKIWGLIGFYLVVTIAGITLSFFLPYLMQKHGMSDAATGYVSAAFYLALTIPGFLLGRVVCALRNTTMPVCLGMMAVGSLVFPFVPELWAYFVGAILCGFGYGVLQPIFYDKAAELAPTAAESSRILSYIMAANYLGVAVCPLVFAGLTSTLAFIVSALILVGMMLLTIFLRRKFIFNVSDELQAYAPAPQAATPRANAAVQEAKPLQPKK